MNDSDREWVFAGVGCVVAGALLSLITGKHRWFAVGGLGGAALVGYRYYKKSSAIGGDDCHCLPAKRYLKHILKERPDFEVLGAPEIPAAEVPNVGVPAPQTYRGMKGYPVSFRVPDAEVHIDTMDDRIRPHFVGPLGPENDPVRYW